MRRLMPAVTMLVALPLAATTACGSSAAATKAGPATTLRLGYFANVTHAAAILGIAKGFFQQHLGATQQARQRVDA